MKFLKRLFESKKKYNHDADQIEDATGVELEDMDAFLASIEKEEGYKYSELAELLENHLTVRELAVITAFCLTPEQKVSTVKKNLTKKLRSIFGDDTQVEVQQLKFSELPPEIQEEFKKRQGEKGMVVERLKNEDFEEINEIDNISGEGGSC